MRTVLSWGPGDGTLYGEFCLSRGGALYGGVCPVLGGTGGGALCGEVCPVWGRRGGGTGDLGPVF